jgi:lactate dehydrogenase-like 2-hydroxyacid dehydrogenase
MIIETITPSVIPIANAIPTVIPIKIEKNISKIEHLKFENLFLIVNYSSGADNYSRSLSSS